MKPWFNDMHIEKMLMTIKQSIFDDDDEEEEEDEEEITAILQ